MNKMPAFNAATLFCLVLVLSCAACTRVGYLMTCVDHGRAAPALLVQGRPPDDHLADNMVDNHWFGGKTPLADEEEVTAHVAPGYPMLRFAAAYFLDTPDQLMRWLQWLQCGLGILTAGFYFFFARRAFHSTVVALLAGLLVALHPFWILNTPELNDGVLASFMLGLCLMLGARVGQQGGAFSSLFFGLALAGLALVRAAFLPFAIVALLWFLWQCRRFPLGWFAGVLALLGFANGLAPWCLRNHELCERPVPIATSAYWHLWMGNNPHATGATVDETVLRGELSDERLKELLDEPNQARRYNMLAHEVWTEVSEHPAQTIGRRIKSALTYLFGSWLKDQRLTATQTGHTVAEPPAWLTDNAELALLAALAGMLAVAFFGWRLSYAWRKQGRLAVIAVLFLPLPYVLGHAEALSGPRLPLDGVLLCLAAYALASLIPGVARAPEAEAR
jgi:hypothetical protein